MARELLFSVTKKDFDVQAFRAGGKGGQHQNKTSSAVRIVHKDSGAVGECRNFRHQSQNKKEAFRRLVDSKKFRHWHKMECSRQTGALARIEAEVDKAMQPENLKIEYYEPR